MARLAPESPRPIPVTVIGGFLGAGKTTLLNRMIRSLRALPSEPKVAVLVNDFGSINIDADLIVDVEGDMVSLGGGCICCSIRADLTRSIFDMASAADAPDHIVIEASGVSDPRSVARALAAPHLHGRVHLDGVVVVVDADDLLRAGFRRRLVAGGQLKAADIVVLNKSDLLSHEDLARVETRVRKTVPRARVLRTSYGSVPLELVLGGIPGGPESCTEPTGDSFRVALREAGAPEHEHEHEYEHEHAAAFSTWSYATDAPLSARRLKRVIETLPASVFRVKGIVQITRERLRQAVLHVVGRRAELQLGAPWGSTPPQSRLVFIGAPGGIDPVALRASLRACEASEPDAELGVLRWMRDLW